MDIVYFLIETDSSEFYDTHEITSDNIISYMQAGGKKAHSSAPEPDVYREAFEKSLAEFDEVILVAISSEISLSGEYAANDLGEKGKHVHIFQSGHLSSGLGHLVMKAAEMAENGHSASEIMAALKLLNDKVSTSFITKGVEYLYRNGKVSEKVKKICSAFNVHPILVMKNVELAFEKDIATAQYGVIFYVDITLKTKQRPNILLYLSLRLNP